MEEDYNNYESPFSSRYASNEMKYLFSSSKKFKTWRLLWIALAKSQKELGLNITDEQIDEMIKYKDDINFEEANKQEKIVRHDVMAHIYAYGLQCPLAKPIIHLGATSCYVGDNADLIIMRDALYLIKNKIISVISNLSFFADEYKSLPTLGFTHFQAAQLTTVGKRATLWIHDLFMDLCDITNLEQNLKMLGCKGTTGTQASFLELFNNNSYKVLQLDKLIAEQFGYKNTYPISGQTYSRKADSQFMNILRGIAESSAKFSNDIRLLQHLKEIEEPFNKNQVGSSAMAYKRNPMRTERMAGIARYVIANSINPALTTSTQWFERTLDDSSNKRIAMPEAFLAVDSILNIYLNVADGLVVYPNIIEKHINEEIAFMATENILMDAVKNGGDRQILHEKIRTHSMDAAYEVKVNGNKNDLIERLLKDDSFNLNEKDIINILEPSKYIGLAPLQVTEFLKNYINPMLLENKHLIIQNVSLNV